jgi:hypothetical protein
MGGKPRPEALSAGIVQALDAISVALRAYPGRAAIIGGIAVIARGVRRLTRDVDVTIEAPVVEAPSVLGVLHRVGIAPRIPDAVQFAHESHFLLMRHQGSGVDVDVSFASLPFELESIHLAPMEAVAGVRLPVSRAEDLIIYKAIAWRPQDQQDVERLLALHARAIDLVRVRRHVAELSEALEVDRSRQLESLIRGVLPDRSPGGG